jgi:hypothetical protein
MARIPTDRKFGSTADGAGAGGVNPNGNRRKNIEQGGSLSKTTFQPVDASPVKSFFVHMLTRDIRLEEAILDLLDNSVDGILRSHHAAGSDKTYEGFRAEIEFKKDSFSISDNCGGIPWNLHDYAFRMGRSADRPQDAPGTVGVYGIGMKRAIFKMGRKCLISTQNNGQSYDVEITPEWTDDEDKWKIPVSSAKGSMPEERHGCCHR